MRYCLDYREGEIEMAIFKKNKRGIKELKRGEIEPISVNSKILLACLLTFILNLGLLLIAVGHLQ